MLQLHDLKKLTKKRNRVGRGGCRGGTSGKGHKGQLARAGGKMAIKAFFEGGQMPLSRRLPRRGFTNIFKKEYLIISLRDLDRTFNAGDVVTRAALQEKGVIRRREELPIKLLCNGAISKKLTVQVDAWSKTAEQAIKKAGGVVHKENEGGTAS
jgi:large subunit ribosomal protein L15